MLACRRRSVFILTAFAALYFGALFPSPEHCAFNKDDGGYFLTLGINLAEYGRYTTDTFPIDGYGQHGTWPFVFPLALAAVVKVFGVSWIALKLLMASFGVFNLYLLLRLWDGETPGYWAAVLTGLNAVYFLFSHTTMTEVPFMLACTVTLLFMERSQTLGGALGAGLSAGLAFLIRGYAIAFLPAGALYFVLNRDRPWPVRTRLLAATSFGVPLLLTIVAWTAFTNDVASSGHLDGITARYGNIGVLQQRTALPIEKLAREIYWYHLRTPLYFLFPVKPWNEMLEADLIVIPTFLALAAAVAGWAHSFWRRCRALDAWLPVGIALMIACHPAPRYWLTYIPFVVYYALYAVWIIVPEWNRVPRLAVVGLLLVGSTLGLGRHLIWSDELRFLNPYWKEYRDLAVWCRANLPEDAVVVAPHASNFYVGSVRRTYAIGAIESDTWPPRELSAESRIYLVYPNADLPYGDERKAAAKCADLIRTHQFRLAREQPNLKLYQWDGR